MPFLNADFPSPKLRLFLQTADDFTNFVCSLQVQVDINSKFWKNAGVIDIHVFTGLSSERNGSNRFITCNFS